MKIKTQPIPWLIFSLLFLFVNGNPVQAQTGSPKTVHPQIIRTIPHDPDAFTQGLVFYDNELLESTGIVGQSSLRRLNAATSDKIAAIAVPDVFAEGLALKDNMLFQLTWNDKKVLIYTYPDLRFSCSLSYEGEGWGLTTDGKVFIMSNGTDTLYFRDDRFMVQKKLPVTLSGKPLVKLNELEYAKKLIFANVWYENYLAVINPKTGKVQNLIDCSNLVRQVDMTGAHDVLNGIAYDKEKDVYYITGKNWALIFIVKLDL